MRLIVNIPAYNEEEKIQETIKRIPRRFEGIDEVLVQVVDDGSSDRTATTAKEAGADFVCSTASIGDSASCSLPPARMP